MSDIARLESEILSAVSAAGDEAALEAVRVAALGKKRLGLGAAEHARHDDAGRAQEPKAR